MAWWAWRRPWPRGFCRYWYLWMLSSLWASKAIAPPPTVIPAYPPIPRETEIQVLESYKRFLEEELERVEERLRRLKEQAEA